MKKTIVAASAVFAASALLFADGFSVSGYIRAGLSSTFEDTPALSTKTWLGGIYFNGDSSKTRGRVNLAFDGKSDAGNKYGAFMRLEYTGSDDAASASWGYGGVNYAFAYTGLFNNMITVSAGKLKDNWIASSGFEGWSVLDKKAGAAVTFSPVQGLNITGAGIIDYSKNASGAYETKADTFLGGIKYKNDMFTADAAYAGYGLITANFSYTGTKDLLISAEGKFETDHGVDTLKDQRVLTDEQIQYTGVDKWTFGVLSFQYADKASVSGDSDFTFTVTPAAAYQLDNTFRFSVEGTYTQPLYDNAPDSYITVVPAVRMSADKSASATVWALISSDKNQEKSRIGLGVIKEF